MIVLKNFFKKNLGLLITLPIFLNFTLNFRYEIFTSSSINFKELVSSLFLFFFLFLIGYSIKEISGKKFTITAGIITYFISFFIFESIFLFFFDGINLHDTFLFANLLWVLFFIIKLDNKYILFANVLTFILLRTYNSIFISDFIKNKNIEGDVKDVFLINSTKIYDESFFSSITNPIMSGYPQFMSYIDAFLYKLAFSGQSYVFMMSTTFVFLWLFYLLFFECGLSTRNNLAIVIFFTGLILNSQWLEFLFVSSLMSERIASYIFLGLLVNLKRTHKENSLMAILPVILFSFVYLTKQFFSLLLLFIFIYYLVNKNLRNYSIFLLFAYIFRQLQHTTYFKNIPKDHHISQIDLYDTILDLILFRDLLFSNINEIIKNLFIDKPVVYLIIIFFIINFFDYFKFKNFANFNSALFILALLNFIFVFMLYISVWQTMELESPIRYFYSFIPVYILSIFLNLEKIQDN